MSKKNVAILALATAALLLTGCSITTTQDKPKGSPSATPNETQTAEDFVDSLYPGGMVKVIQAGNVTNLDIQDGIDSAQAKEAYAWLASFIQISFNDSTLQDMKTFRQYGLLSFSQYFTPVGLKIMEAHFSEYADQNDYSDFDKALRYIGNRGLMTVIPSEGYKFLNSPVFDQFQYGEATIQSAGLSDEGLPVYKISVPVSARLLVQDQADKKTYETTFNRTFEVWVIDMGDPKKPFLIDSWNENPLSSNGVKTVE
jgi:hypothetical protein